MFERMQTFYYNTNLVVLQPKDITNEKQPNKAANSVIYTAYQYYAYLTQKELQ